LRDNSHVAAGKTDYYDLLGVRRDADTETIRQAFEDAARECRLGLSASPDDEQRFSELAEAYAVLSKPALRLVYDRYGYRGRGSSGIAEALEQVAGVEHVVQELALRPFEAADGTSRVVRYEAAETCPACQGLGSAHEPDPDCPVCAGTGRNPRLSENDVRRLLGIDTCPKCTPDPCTTCGGFGRVSVERELRVRTPPGLTGGEQLRVSGEGSVGRRGGVPGDLLLDVRVLPAARDRRLVRYLALLLFLAAVAVLVVYVR
jgi:molecular chaperone DnaJ